MTLPKYIYHLAESTNWPSIQRDGLLCASTLIRRAGLRGMAREALERQQRPTHTALPDGARIRDQRPMPPAALARCLVEMSPAEWYALINAHVFFWLDAERLNRQRRACADRPQVVLTIDVAKLIAAHADRIAVTPINTGNARRQPAKRGAATFVPLHLWLESAWASEAAALGTTLRARSHAPVELAVASAVPDLKQFIVRLDKLRPHEPFVGATRFVEGLERLKLLKTKTRLSASTCSAASDAEKRESQPLGKSSR